MLWGIRRNFTNWGNIFRRPFGRGSIYRLERLRSVARLGKNKENGKIDDEKNKISVDKGIKKYEKRKLNAKNQKSYKFLNIKNILLSPNSGLEAVSNISNPLLWTVSTIHSGS